MEPALQAHQAANCPHTQPPQPPCRAHSALAAWATTRPGLSGGQAEAGEVGAGVFPERRCPWERTKEFPGNSRLPEAALGSSTLPVFWAHFACSALSPRPAPRLSFALLLPWCWAPEGPQRRASTGAARFSHPCSRQTFYFSRTLFRKRGFRMNAQQKKYLLLLPSIY